jgi:ATP-dependent RNA helicase DDX43
MRPILLKGLDYVGIVQTGTGKTLAFLLPALIHIDGQTTPRSERLGPNVLVLSPARELALQIEKEVKKINYKGITSVCIYGGGDRKEQISVCTRGVEIIIGTPGRLYDLMKAGAMNVTSVTYLVMNEADRMQDLGFEPQILKILLDIRPDRQTVMTSATWPSGVRRLATKYLKEPIQLYVDTLDLRAAKSVEQHIVILKAEDDKTTMLMDYIENKMEPEDKLIVFVSRKSTADTLSCDLILKNISCQSIHGDREQCDREQALEDFKESYVKILIATDVASRGIDMKDITCVFNYDFPHNMEEYVHRVGRTGRAGRTGKSITLMTRQDWKNAKELIEILQEGGQEVLPELIDMAERYEAMKRRKMEEEGSFGGGGRGGRGGRGGASGCFNCGKEGHMSRECPSGGGGGGRGRGRSRGGGNRW